MKTVHLLSNLRIYGTGSFGPASECNAVLMDDSYATEDLSQVTCEECSKEVAARIAARLKGDGLEMVQIFPSPNDSLAQRTIDLQYLNSLPRWMEDDEEI